MAVDVLERAGKLMGLSEHVGFTVEDNGMLDLSTFEVTMHAGILLDGVGDAQMLADRRETLQGHTKTDRGGKSTTMIYSYEYTLYRRAVVATMEMAARNLAFFAEHHWLSHPDSAMVLRLDRPAFCA